MNFSISSWSQVRAWIRELAAVVGVVLSVTNAVAWPTAVRGTVLAVSGALLGVQHFAQLLLDPSTSINVTNTTPTAPASVPHATPPSN